ncbi:MAG: type II secretion system F family protein [Actinomycetota bacterium]|nr:type II secretion system F family protein [Actinomycetota bacterium]
MPTTYAYKVRDREGKLVTGELEGESQTLVAARLRDMGFTPISVDARGVGLRGDITIPGLTKRVTLKELAVFSRQFATMVDSGLTLLRALTILAAQTKNKRFAQVLDAVRVEVQRGSSLSDALAKHPKVFDHLFLALVRSGELGGTLDAALVSLAGILERQAELRGKIRSAMAYPMVTLCLVLGIAAAMLLFIVPIFAKIFKQLNAKLPKPTLILMVVSRVLVHELPYVIVVVGVGAFVFVKWKKTPRGRELWSAAVQRVPVFGMLMVKTSISRFTSTLSTLLHSGVPVLQALEITSESVNNPGLEHALEDAKASIQQGSPMSSAFQQHGVIPTMVTQMISVGEETGALDEMLGKISDFYDQEVQAMVDALASLLEPLMIVVLGGLVGSMIIALYLPMFSVYKAVEDSGSG